MGKKKPRRIAGHRKNREGKMAGQRVGKKKPKHQETREIYLFRIFLCSRGRETGIGEGKKGKNRRKEGREAP